jgi:peptidoglycan/LPS O-acetylase OafA/YrhL
VPSAAAAAMPAPMEAGTGRAAHYYPCFDGVRALAAVTVLVFHAALFTGAFRGSLGDYLINLDAGVWVFFVASGFLLYRPFTQAHFSGERRPSIPNYFLRRGTRIFPAYWVALFVMTVVLGEATVHGTRNIVRHATLTQRYFGNQLADVFAGLPHAWTLVVEVSFYVFLPCFAYVVVLGARRCSAVAAELGGLALMFVVGVGAVLWASFGDPPQAVLVLPAHLHVFALGMLLAVLVSRPWGAGVTAALAWSGRRPWLWWLLAAAVFVAIPLVFGRASGVKPGPGQALALDLCRTAIGACIVVPAVLGDQGAGLIRRFLRAPWMVFLGVISYGIYLWHYNIVVIVQRDWFGWRTETGNAVMVSVVVFAATVAVATASWYLVERPLIRLVHRRARRA